MIIADEMVAPGMFCMFTVFENQVVCISLTDVLVIVLEAAVASA